MIETKEILAKEYDDVRNALKSIQDEMDRAWEHKGKIRKEVISHELLKIKSFLEN